MDFSANNTSSFGVDLYSTLVTSDPLLAGFNSQPQDGVGDASFASNLDYFYGDINVAGYSVGDVKTDAIFYDEAPLTDNAGLDSLTGVDSTSVVDGDTIEAGSLGDLSQTTIVEIGDHPVDTKYAFAQSNPSQLARDFDSMDEAAIAWYANYWVEIQKATSEERELGEVIIKNSSGKFQFITPEEPITGPFNGAINPTDTSRGGVFQLDFAKLNPLGRIDVVGFVHSHPYTDKFSEADLTSTARNIHRTYLMSPDGVVKRVDPPSNIEDWSLVQRINYSDEWARSEIPDPLENPLRSVFEGAEYIVKDKPRPVQIDVIEY